MTLHELIAATRLSRREVARLLGYAESTLRQVEDGCQTIPRCLLRWLEAYAKLRTRYAAAEAAWLAKHPPPKRRPIPGT